MPRVPRPKSPDPLSEFVSIKMTDAMLRRLRRQAEARERSVGFMIREFVAACLPPEVPLPASAVLPTEP